jgi:prophage regulatory protein
MQNMKQSDRFLRLPEVIAKTGVSRSTIYYWIDQGTFPRQISLGARSAAWLESEINEWMEKKIQQGGI